MRWDPRPRGPVLSFHMHKTCATHGAPPADQQKTSRRGVTVARAPEQHTSWGTCDMYTYHCRRKYLVFEKHSRAVSIFAPRCAQIDRLRRCRAYDMYVSTSYEPNIGNRLSSPDSLAVCLSARLSLRPPCTAVDKQDYQSADLRGEHTLEEEPYTRRCIPTAVLLLPPTLPTAKKQHHQHHHQQQQHAHSLTTQLGVCTCWVLMDVYTQSTLQFTLSFSFCVCFFSDFVTGSSTLVTDHGP